MIRTTPLLIVAAAALALAGCATAASETPSTPVLEPTGAAGCEQVTVVVEFGALDKTPIEACAAAGVATDVLAEVGVTTEGTVDYGDQVICRVNNAPSPEETVTVEGADPFIESCQTLNAAAYWALWVKNSPDAEWEYAQEGATTLQLEDGQSVGLVYTAGMDSTPPAG